MSSNQIDPAVCLCVSVCVFVHTSCCQGQCKAQQCGGGDGGVDVQAASYEAPDAIATCAHPVLKHLRHQMADEARYLEVATLVRQLCHPDVTARATADDALNSSLLMSQ